MTAPTSRAAALILFFIAGVAIALAILVYRLDAGERERDAVRVFMWEMERTLLVPGGTARLLSEVVPPSQVHPEVEPGRDRLRSDLERMARLERLQLLPDNIDVQPEAAIVDYRVVGRPRFGDPPAPFGGKLLLQRTRGGWRLAANHFLEQPPQDAGSAPEKPGGHPPTHSGLSARLGAIAAVALLAGAFLLVQPFVTRARRGSRFRHGRFRHRGR